MLLVQYWWVHSCNTDYVKLTTELWLLVIWWNHSQFVKKKKINHEFSSTWVVCEGFVVEQSEWQPGSHQNSIWLHLRCNLRFNCELNITLGFWNIFVSMNAVQLPLNSPHITGIFMCKRQIFDIWVTACICFPTAGGCLSSVTGFVMSHLIVSKCLCEVLELTELTTFSLEYRSCPLKYVWCLCCF